MTKRSRTILFIVCVILFLIIAPSVFLYSMGYRIDFNSRKIVQTGGFYFKVLPKDAKVYLDGKFKKNTDFLFGSVFIKNLLPKRYEIEIKKEGYLPWKKNLEIQEKMVTEARNIVLIPKNPKFTILGENIKNFFFSPNEKKLILDSKENLKLLEIEKEIREYPIEKIAEEELKEVIFSPDSRKALLKIDSKFYFLDLTKTPFSLIEPVFLKPEIKEISFNPRDLSKIFFIEDNELFEGNLEKNGITPLLKEILTYQISGENIYYLDDSGFLFKTDFDQKINEKINQIAFPLKDGVDYQLEVFGNFIFLKENEVVYLFNSDSLSFEKFFEPIKSLKTSPDFGKIVFFNNHEIFVFFLRDFLDQPSRKIKEKVFLTRFSEKIGDLFWFTSHYLIFNTDSKIKIVEIDDRDRINIYDLPPHLSGGGGLIEFKEEKIFFNQTDKKIYLLSGGNLLVSEKLIP